MRTILSIKIVSKREDRPSKYEIIAVILKIKVEIIRLIIKLFLHEIKLAFIIKKISSSRINRKGRVQLGLQSLRQHLKHNRSHKT